MTRACLVLVTTIDYTQVYCSFKTWGRILGRNRNKSLKSFPPCYSQSPSTNGFYSPSLGVTKRRRKSWLWRKSWLNNSALVYETISHWVQLCIWSPNKLWRSNSIFNLCPLPLRKSGLTLVSNINIVYGTSILRSSKIMPRKLNEIARSWIRLLLFNKKFFPYFFQ
jgi:hypothetical protein